jgi:hypothetical protein
MLIGRNCEVLVTLEATPDAVDAALRAAIQKVPVLRQEDPRSRSWHTGYTPLAQRYVLRIWLDDFAIHDDAESDFLKAFHLEATTRGIALRTMPVRPAVAADGSVVASV